MKPRGRMTQASLLAALAWVVLGCNSSSNPTTPSPPSSGGSAVVSGKATAVTSSGSNVVFEAELNPTLSNLAKSGASGITVTVAGTSISTMTDAGGFFTLNGVPEGDQSLVFSTDTDSGALDLMGIQPQEQIQLEVVLQGSQVNVTSMQRSSSGDAGEEGGTLDVDALSLQLAPDEWNLNYQNSSGTVAAFIRGEGRNLIDLGSIEMLGDNSGADPLPASNASAQGDHVRARFAKNRVIDLLQDPAPGTMHTITIQFLDTEGGGPYALTGEIVIEDDDDEGGDEGEEEGEEEEEEEEGGEIDLTLEIQPSNWNTNWQNNGNGTVSALIRGEGFEDIDLDSILLIGDHPEDAEVSPTSATRQGNNVRARFRQQAAIGSLDDPRPGETRTVTVTFTVNGGEPMELTFDVRINGPGG